MYKENARTAIAKKRYCFKKGYLQVSLANKNALREELMSVLNTTSRHYFSTKLNKGIIDISVTIFDAITKVFANYEINDCWDIAEIE